MNISFSFMKHHVQLVLNNNYSGNFKPNKNLEMITIRCLKQARRDLNYNLYKKTVMIKYIIDSTFKIDNLNIKPTKTQKHN